MTNSLPAGRKSRKFIRYLWWLTTAGWAAMIFDLSTSIYGGFFTAWVLHQALSLLRLTVTPQTFEVLHYLLRKSAHLTEYLCFSVLLYGSFGGATLSAWRPRRAGAAFAVAALYSLSDEFHQLFEPGRSASLFDSGIDTLGAALGILILYACLRRGPASASSTAAAQDSPAEI